MNFVVSTRLPYSNGFAMPESSARSRPRRPGSDGEESPPRLRSLRDTRARREISKAARAGPRWRNRGTTRIATECATPRRAKGRHIGVQLEPRASFHQVESSFEKQQKSEYSSSSRPSIEPRPPICTTHESPLGLMPPATSSNLFVSPAPLLSERIDSVRAGCFYGPSIVGDPLGGTSTRTKRCSGKLPRNGRWATARRTVPSIDGGIDQCRAARRGRGSGMLGRTRPVSDGRKVVPWIPSSTTQAVAVSSPARPRVQLRPIHGAACP